MRKKVAHNHLIETKTAEGYTMIRYTFGNPDRYHAVKAALTSAGYRLQSVCHQGTGTIIVDHPKEGREATDYIFNQASGALRAQITK